MIRHLLKPIFFVALFGILGNARAQDIHFSQFYQAPLLLNPALAGTSENIRANTSYKNQWSSIASPYRTYALSCDVRIRKQKWKNGFLGAGLYAFSDKAGDAQLGTTQVAFTLSSIREIAEQQYLSAGIQSAFVQKGIQVNNLRSDNQFVNGTYDPTLPLGEIFGSTRFSYIDFGAGVQWNYGKGEMYMTANDEMRANAGVSMFHFSRPDQSFLSTGGDPLYFKIVGHGMLHIGIKNTNTAVVPSFLYMRQGPSQEITVGSLFRYSLKEDSRYTGFVKSAAVSLGAHYRLQDALIITTLFEVANYALGVSYDVNISQLSAASNGRGGIELSLRYVNPVSFLYKGFK